MTNQEQTAFVTRSQLVDDLQRLGLRHGDTVMLHASVKAIGWVVGGPQQVLQALFDVLSLEGTVMMLASWEGNPYDLSDIPEEQHAMLLENWPPFDPESTPADHRELSILAEYLRIWPPAQNAALTHWPRLSWLGSVHSG